MTPDRRLLKFLGAAFVAVFATSLASGVLSGPFLTGSMYEVWENLSKDVTALRASILLQLITSVGIVALASLLYSALKTYHRTLALIAFGWWLAEAVVLAVSVLATQALIPLSVEWVNPAFADHDYLTSASGFDTQLDSLGTALLDIERNAVTMHMLFFCFGAMIWYFLMFRSRIVPRWLSVWGLAAVPLMFVSTLLILWNRDLDPGMLPYLPYVPFELVIGVWLLMRGGSKKALPA